MSCDQELQAAEAQLRVGEMLSSPPRLGSGGQRALRELSSPAPTARAMGQEAGMTRPTD